MITIQEVLFQALTELGTDWVTLNIAEIRNDIKKVGLFVAVNSLIKEGIVNAEDLKKGAVEFCTVYKTVMLRDIQETIVNGDDH